MTFTPDPRWLDVSQIAVDIETHETPLPHQPGHTLSKAGLSVIAQITDVALFHPDIGSLVLDMRDYDPYLERRSELAQAKAAWLRQVFSRDHVQFIGHNVLFDLRNLGVMYGFRLARHALVWDTLTMGKRLLLGEQVNQNSSVGDSFDLLSLFERLEVVDESAELSLPVLEFMKQQRKALTRLSETLAGTPADDPIWQEIGYIPPNRKDLLAEVAAELTTKYVASDAKMAYLIAQKQRELAERMIVEDFHFGRFFFHKWPELEELLSLWQRYLRIAANSAIQGIPLDLEYLESQIEKQAEIVERLTQDVVESRDTHDPYPEFEKVFGWVYYYDNLLKLLLDYDNNKLGDWHKRFYWDRDVASMPKPNVRLISDAFIWPSGTEDAVKREWYIWLESWNTSITNKQQVQKLPHPATMPPRIDLEKWVRINCYDGRGYDEMTVRFLSKIKVDWLSALYKETGELTAEKLTNKKAFKPYFMYAICGCPLPSDEALKYESALTTKRFKTATRAYRQQHGCEPPSYQEIAIDIWAFSYGKGSMDYFLEMGDNEHHDIEFDIKELQPFRNLLQAKSYLQWFITFREHAAFDGKIHSYIPNDTQTGRCSSKAPNLQNIPMSGNSPFPGMFRAEEGFWLAEIDIDAAELYMAAMIGADDALAEMLVGRDFHREVLAVYIPELYQGLLEAGAKDQIKYWRNFLKRVTYGTNYGMAAYSLALALHVKVEEAKTILENKKRTFWRSERAKERIHEGLVLRMNDGTLPVYMSLWDGDRAQIPRKNHNKTWEIAPHVPWNYAMQGGTGRVISLTQVIAQEWLEDNGYKTNILLNIHDSLIVAANVEEFHDWETRTNPIHYIIQTLCSRIPAAYLQRCVPYARIIASFGNDNAGKWGMTRREGEEYPLYSEYFINQWGRHQYDEETLKLPLPKQEPPTHYGGSDWTLEGEIAEALEQRGLKEVLGNRAAAVSEDGAIWDTYQEILYDLGAPLKPGHEGRYARMTSPISVTYDAWDTKRKTSYKKKLPNLLFAAFMKTVNILYHDNQYAQFPELVKRAVEFADEYEAFNQWRDEYYEQLETILELTDYLQSTRADGEREAESDEEQQSVPA